MNTILHDPTRGWLLLTPEGLIKIIETEERQIENLVNRQLAGLLTFQENQYYSVDAEFEVKEQFSTHPDYWVDKCVHWIERNIPGIEYRQIARLVKAKEDTKQKEYAEIQSKQITNPTDPKEGIEVEKSGKEIKLYSDENQAVITSMFINGEEWVKRNKTTI